MEKYICIHGHFYQPPRENPWLEAVETQDSAHPYHDWNERITEECYAANTASRILDQEQKIVEIVNNYSRISFNFGPTLLSWLEAYAPGVYEKILAADAESASKFSGHGSALAQVYNHMIMPLASRRDKYTQIRWAIEDFRHRFKRVPEGMWLAETAADVETLEIMAELGVRFTVLAPHQAKRVRRKGGRRWQDASESKIDPSMPYQITLPSGKKMSIFFYDGPVSRAVAFEGLLSSGERFTERLMSAFSPKREHAQLVHIATDGETYGHHHQFGDMGLAYALHHIEANGLARLTNYGEFLEKFPPSHEVRIIDNTSWSCMHGIERWRSDCGCNTGGESGWCQAWRAPLRDALDWLRDELEGRYEQKARAFLRDPWAARDAYISVALDRTLARYHEFLGAHAHRILNEAEQSTVLKLLELQRHAMLMYTSCGWFFSEISGIETVQIIQYASRAVQLAREVFGEDLEPAFLERLEKAVSNIPDHRNGRWIYENFVRPAIVDPMKVAGHYAISSLFEDYAEEENVYCYTIRRGARKQLRAGKMILAAGEVRATSEITREECVFYYGAFYSGIHTLEGGVRTLKDGAAFDAIWKDLESAFAASDHAKVKHLLEKHFGSGTFSLTSLFKDEQRKILGQIINVTLEETESLYRQLYDERIPLMRFIGELKIPLPRVFQTTAEFVLSGRLSRALAGEKIDLEEVRKILAECTQMGIKPDGNVALILQKSVERVLDRAKGDVRTAGLLEDLNALLELAASSAFAMNRWRAQNLYYDIAKTTFGKFSERSEAGDEWAKRWCAAFTLLGTKLAVKLLARGEAVKLST